MKTWLWQASMRVGGLVVTAIVFALTIADPGLAAEFSCASGDVACLIGAINTANTHGQDNTIKLAAGTYTLTAVNNTNGGGTNGLPRITSNLSIIGAGANATVIQRDASAPPFRLFSLESGTLILEELTLRGGLIGPQSFPGGGIRTDGGILIISSCAIVDNSAGSGGGGIAANSVTVTNSTIAHNSTSDFGGGGILVEFGPATITNSTITNNSAAGGGGIIVGGGMSIITNSTIAYNSTRSGLFITSGGGGGLFVTGDGTATLTNSTIAHNSAEGFGGGLRNSENNPVILQNTILAENTGGSGGPDCFVAANTVTSLGHNLIGNLSDCPITLLSTDLTGSPGLGPFIDDGTPGNGHFPLLPNSQAIDMGDNNACPDHDQLGNPRPVDGNGDGTAICDIGAIEFQPVLTVLTVVIDILPGEVLNPINPKKQGVIPVAILTTATFDATTVNASTVRFGKTGKEAAPVQVAVEDVNGDGLDDLILHFNTPDTGIQCGDTSASLTGQTFSGQAIQGSDSIVTVGCR
jgi:hypothetical protein